MSSYLDASFLVAVVVEERQSRDARAWMKDKAGDIIISALAAMEVSATLSRGVRTRRFTQAQARAALSDFDALRIAGDTYWPDPATFELADHLVRDFVTKLAAPDALHVASALRVGAVLVTFDARMATAASTLGLHVADLATGAG